MQTPDPRGEPKLLDQVRDLIRLKHYSIRTEQAYLGWIRRFILFHHKRHPREMGKAEIEAFLTHLAVQENVAASTQNQAMNAILFLYRHVLKQDLDWLEDVTRAKRPVRLPVVLTVPEVQAVLTQLEGQYWLMASPAVWFRPKTDGMPAPARQGPGIDPAGTHRARWQGCQG